MSDSVRDQDDDNDAEMPDASPANCDDEFSSGGSSEYDGANESSSDEDFNMSDQPSLPPGSISALVNDSDDDMELDDQPCPLPTSSSALVTDPNDEWSDVERDNTVDSNELTRMNPTGLSRQRAFNAYRRQVFNGRRPRLSLLPRAPTEKQLARGAKVPDLPDGTKFCANRRCRYAKPLVEFEREDAEGNVHETKFCKECREDINALKLNSKQASQEKANEVATEDPSMKLCRGPCNRVKPLEEFRWMSRGVMGTFEHCVECGNIKRKNRDNHAANAQEKVAKQNECTDVALTRQKVCKRCVRPKNIAKFVRITKHRNGGKPYEHRLCNRCAAKMALYGSKRSASLAPKPRKQRRRRRLSDSKEDIIPGHQWCKKCKRHKPVAKFTRSGLAGSKIRKAWAMCNKCYAKGREREEGGPNAEDHASKGEQFCKLGTHWKPVAEFTRLGREGDAGSQIVYKAWKICNECIKRSRKRRGYQGDDGN